MPGAATLLGHHYHREPQEKQRRIPERDLHGTACRERAVTLLAWGPIQASQQSFLGQWGHTRSQEPCPLVGLWEALLGPGSRWLSQEPSGTWLRGSREGKASVAPRCGLWPG